MSSTSPKKQAEGPGESLSGSQFNTLLASIEKMSKRFDKLEEDLYASDMDEDDQGSIEDSFAKAKMSKCKLTFKTGPNLLHNTDHDISDSNHDDNKNKDVHKAKKHKLDPDSDKNLEPAQAVTKACENDPDFKELLDVYNSIKPKALADPVTDPIPEPLTKILESWTWGHYSSTEIKTEQAKNK